MRLRFWKKKPHTCDKEDRITILKKELRIKDAEIVLNEWKYNQLLERTLIENSEEDFI